MEYPGTPEQAAGNVSVLWQADLADQRVLERGLVTPAAWSEASLRWLVAPAVIPASSADMPGGVRVGMADVARFRDTAEMFRELDDRFGGGHARGALIQYLQADAVRLLRGRYPDTLAALLLSAVAEAVLLAAWMTYDSAPGEPAGAAVLHPALGLAQEAATGCSARRSWTR